MTIGSSPMSRNHRSICLLAFSDIISDPRVRRQGDAFHAAGWSVVAVGLPGRRNDKQPAWTVITASRDPLPVVPDAPGIPSSAMLLEPPIWTLEGLILRLARYPLLMPIRKMVSAVVRTRRTAKALILLCVQFTKNAVSIIGHCLRTIVPGNLRTALGFIGITPLEANSEYALKEFWSWPATIDLYTAAKQVTADIWLANDWTTLPIAARLAEENGGVYVYDTHELATAEYEERLRWRLLEKPRVRAIEGKFIRQAKHVSAVSSGIAKKLYKLYALNREPLVIRNVPSFRGTAFRKTPENSIRVLYHGIVVPNRGLAQAIDSVQDWHPRFSLTIRGPGDADYLAALRSRVAALGLEERVELAPPVPMTELVSAASVFDVGLFALPSHSLHNIYALPNKFFEYIMAGLALCVSDLPEMSAIVAQYELGVLVPRVRSEAIAAAINSLDAETIDRYKSHAIEAARELCWEAESVKLVNACDSLAVALR